MMRCNRGCFGGDRQYAAFRVWLCGRLLGSADLPADHLGMGLGGGGG